MWSPPRLGAKRLTILATLALVGVGAAMLADHLTPSTVEHHRITRRIEAPVVIQRQPTPFMVGSVSDGHAEKIEGTRDESHTTESPQIIPGLKADAVKRRLGSRFSFTGPRQIPGKNVFVDEGNWTMSVTGIKVSARIRQLSDTQVQGVTFRIDATSVSGEVNEDLFHENAEFLGWWATVPYKDARPGDAQFWVEEHIAETSQVTATTVIGSARFTLSGGPYMRFLSLEAIPQE